MTWDPSARPLRLRCQMAASNSTYCWTTKLSTRKHYTRKFSPFIFKLHKLLAKFIFVSTLMYAVHQQYAIDDTNNLNNMELLRCHLA